MDYYIETYHNGVQLLGTDFTRLVKNCKTTVKLNNAIKSHKKNIDSLINNIYPFLKDGYDIKITKDLS